MKFQRRDFHKTMEAVFKRARAYLEAEAGVEFLSVETAVGSIDILELQKVTVIVGAGGPVSLLISFCFDQSLLDQIYEISTAGLGIGPDERELFLREAAAETVNSILGHATADLAEAGNDVTLSPPVVLEEGRRIHRPKKAMFATLRIQTNFGILDIYFIGPSELFDQKLNLVSNNGKGSMAPMKVLIVDDSLLIVRTLTNLLNEMGHVVVQTAGTGALALDAYRSCLPDLVTMDITMPDMDGIEATSTIIKEFPDAKIIMVTSHGQEGMVMKAIKAGAKGYVLKPVKPESLRDVIARIIK